MQIREKFSWLTEYDADWPTTTIMKQYLRNCRNSASRKTRKAATSAAAAAAATTTVPGDSQF